MSRSKPQDWPADNAAYLASALAWLRLRLLYYIEQQRVELSPPLLTLVAEADSEPEPALTASGRRSRRGAAAAETLLERDGVTYAQVKEAAAKMEATGKSKIPPALVVLEQRLGLSPFERDILLLCAAMELDTHTASLCAEAQVNPARPYPTFALALALFEQPSWDALAAHRPLRHWLLIEVAQGTGQSLTASALRADEHIVNYLKGLDYLDDRLATLMLPLPSTATSVELTPSQKIVAARIVRYWQSASDSGELPIIQLAGSDEPSKQLIAQQAVAQINRQLYYTNAEMWPGQASEVETLARLWQRESLLFPLALYLDTQEADSGAATTLEGKLPTFIRFLLRSDGVFFLGVRESWPLLARSNFSLDVAKPTQAEQQAIWFNYIGASVPDAPALLTAQFSLNVPAIQQLAQTAQNELEAGEYDESDLTVRLWEACRISVRLRLDNLAQRLDADVTWDDLILPSVEMNLLRQIADQVAQRSQVYQEWGFAAKSKRGLGINVLFAGPSGTGKTLSAEVLATHLRLNLYRIDLAGVVSKYIGETEKNLRRLFDAAEDGGVILFFDEADALFGKRSEVKDSHDRYANIEIDYLLQRMEAYNGLAILATNLKSALDPAFTRRLRFVVNFPFPGPAERKRMWQRVFPPATPTENLDYERLARLNLAGGNIYNVALNAAFMAAQAGSAVKTPMLMAAARAEFQKLDRPISEADFK